jgi:hypothetical protein
MRTHRRLSMMPLRLSRLIDMVYAWRQGRLKRSTDEPSTSLAQSAQAADTVYSMIVSVLLHVVFTSRSLFDLVHKWLPVAVSKGPGIGVCYDC